MLRLCAFHGCETLTLGRFCVEHEQPVATRTWPKGRPFPDYERDSASLDLCDDEPLELTEVSSGLSSL